ncbi:MAG TPA: hypothetical protein VGA61_07785, partial [Anaerolineae bacterium]
MADFRVATAGAEPSGGIAHTPALYRRLDAVMLAVLLIARVRIDSLADASALPFRQQDVARQPFFSHLLSADAMKLLAQQQVIDPIGLLLIVAALGCLLAYFLVDEFVRRGRTAYRLKLALIWLIIVLTVFAPSSKMILLRRGSGPASYSHDGGVIQTEATIDFFLHGQNPYRENYLQTPMAEWGINEFRTALYHYPYLPWTFLFSTPFRLLADRLIGWYDQRFVYLLLFALTLALLPGLMRRRPDAGADSGANDGVSFGRPAGQPTLLLVMLIGLNPMMGLDLIYGQNDSFILAWIVLSLWFLARADGAGSSRAMLGSRPRHRMTAAEGWYLASAAAFGLACASKPTAWFLAPGYLLLLGRARTPDGDGRERAGRQTGRPRLAAFGAWLERVSRRGWPALAAVILIIGPYLIWDAGSLIDDVWKWSAGTSPTSYQIWGWGASNLVLALGWVKTRFAYWPFWIPELLLGGPLLAALLWRQWRTNTAGHACRGYAIFLFLFFFVSRFLNENYLGYILAFLVLGMLLPDE